MSTRIRPSLAVLGAVLVAGLGVVLPTYLVQQDSPTTAQGGASPGGSAQRGPGLAANPKAMAAVLEARARDGLKSALSSGTSADFAPLTAGLTRLKGSEVAKAESAYVEFGSRAEGRTWRVYVAPAIDESLACPEPLPAALLKCSIEETSAGQIRTTTMATRTDPTLGPNDFMLIQNKEELESTPLSDIRLELNVRNYWSDGSETSVSETVFAPTTLAPEQAFVAQESDLVGLVSDEALRWGAKP